MGYRSCIVLVVVLFFNYIGLAQSPALTFGFNNCTSEEDNTLAPGLTLVGDPICVCGPKGNSYQLNGVDQYMTLSPLLNSRLKDDFTFDFYFTNISPTSETHLMYMGTCANVDSLMRLRYFDITKDYLFEISGSVNNFFSVRFKVDESKCWHRFTLVKFKLEYFLYIDSRLVKKFLAKETIVFPRNTGVNFGFNPCIGTTGANLRGQFDEISLKNTPSSEQTIAATDIYADRIASPSITIFSGDIVNLEVGEFCGDILWTPSSSLSNDDQKKVEASPLETTTYQVNINTATCTSIDSVIVFVTNKDSLDCTNLLLPSAFTPNGDNRNDLYGIDNVFIVDALESFEIFARNGAKLWETNDINQKWDGNANGSSQVNGTYLYNIKYTCNNKAYIKTKTFVLIR